MSGYPEKMPGWKGSVATGREGAQAFAPKLGRRQKEALDALAAGPMTADQVALMTGRHWYLTRPRISELKALGLVTETGEARPGAFGGKTHVVRLTTEEERTSFAARKEAVDACHHD